ncbi:MAG: STAS domain-containing protein [Actinobacteria bacterium]|nr:STAS domain-containing protein [Actinomycetota bacterium]
MTSFQVDEVRAGVSVIRVEGRLNMVAAPELRDVVAQAVASGRTRLVVDLSGVEFMDSSGLGALIGALKTTRQAGGDLRIASPGEQVTMVLQLSNVDRILKPYRSSDDAFTD